MFIGGQPSPIKQYILHGTRQGLDEVSLDRGGYEPNLALATLDRRGLDRRRATAAGPRSPQVLWLLDFRE